MLFLLKRIGRVGYDHCGGFVIRADSHDNARWLAAESAADEGPQTWLNPDHSTCVILDASGPSGVILTDFRAG